MKQKYWKLLLAIVALLAAVVLLCADVIPRKNGSLLHIYDIDEESLASCMLYEGQTVYRSESPETLQAVKQLLLELEWKPCKEVVQTTPFDLFLKTKSSNLSISIDCLDCTTVRVHVDGLPVWKKDHGTYCVKEPYNVEAIKAALGSLIP